MGRRDRAKLIADLLRAARNSKTKTHLFRIARMNHEQGSRYLALCLDKGLIAKVEETFRPTDQGAAYLENWSKIEGYLTR